MFGLPGATSALQPGLKMQLWMGDESKGAPKVPMIRIPNPQNPLNAQSIAILSGVIEDPIHYQGLIRLMDEAVVGDEIKLIIDSPGGAVVTALNIISAMMHTKAKVITIANGRCMSCGSLIWTYGHVLVGRPMGSWMFHATTNSDFNLSAAVAERALGLISFANQVLRDTQSRSLLTDSELKLILEDKQDVYLTYEQMAPRIEAANKVTNFVRTN